MRQSIIPALQYEDAPSAIEFLCKAFGFERHLVVAEDPPSRIVHHAQLLLNGGMIMLGSANAPPSATMSSCICVVVSDPDAHYARAKAAGADILHPPRDNEGYPGRSYEVKDSGGYRWNFNSFDPWAEAI